MAEEKAENSVQANLNSTAVGGINVGGNAENIIVGNNNVINYYAPDTVTRDTVTPDTWNLKHPYPMPPNFTGRIAERAMLTRWLNDDAENHLFILRALGGFGKSALTWHWLTHDVDEQVWSRVVFWSFYEGDASFGNFVAETLAYLKLDAPQGTRAQVEVLLQAMQREKILLVLDGFERALRAFGGMSAAYQGDDGQWTTDDRQLDCVDVNAETFLRGVCALPRMMGKALMTTRLTPRVVKPRGECLQGCREVELTALSPADAVEFFHKQGVAGRRDEIESACAAYDFHPLSLRLLAGRILKDFENPGDINIAQRLRVDGDLIQQKHHILQVAYESLTPPQQKLLGQIACFRAPVEFKTLQSIVEDRDALDPNLRDLLERGLVHAQSTKSQSTTFDLHPIVRRYAYDHFADEKRRKEMHEKLVRHFIEVVPAWYMDMGVQTLEDLAPVIELYHHAIGAGHLDEAARLFNERIESQIHHQFGLHQLQIELLRALFLDGEDKPPRLKSEQYQAAILNALGIAYAMSGQPKASINSYEMNIVIMEKLSDEINLPNGLGNLAGQQFLIGNMSVAERNRRRQIDLSRKIANGHNKAIGHQELGRILSYRGAWKEAEQELNKATSIPIWAINPQSRVLNFAYRALRFLLIAKEESINNQSQIKNLNSAIEYANDALKLANSIAEIEHPYPRDYVDAYWLLGAAYRAKGVYQLFGRASITQIFFRRFMATSRYANNELTLAEENLSKALNLCRQINAVDAEADILLDMARLRYAQGDFNDAQEKASEALVITERSGYVLQGADVHLFLAEMAMAGYVLQDTRYKSPQEAAKFHAESALKLATCDGGEYTYKVAYEEAERLLKRMKDEWG